MKSQSPSMVKKNPTTNLVRKMMVIALLFITSCTIQTQGTMTEEIFFYSGSFKIVGNLKLPEGNGPYPVVVFVHGDGPNDRTASGTYIPIMERMESAGYATFAWDKPGTGESTGVIDSNKLGTQRAQIVLDAIEVLRSRSDINPDQIGLWGISQAGFVMPRVIASGENIAFMIAISCPGMAGVEQGAYLVSAQAVCAGASEEKAEQMRQLLAAIERVETYEEYVQIKEQLDAFPEIGSGEIFGYRPGVIPEEEWHIPNLQGEYFWNPIDVIEKTTIPMLAFFGELDTQVDPIRSAQAYQEALRRAGNSNFRVELIPRSDHNIILSKTGCLDERETRWPKEWINYAPEYLDILEEWLRELHQTMDS